MQKCLWDSYKEITIWREIQKEYYEVLNLNEEFTLKGIYSSLPGYPQQMTLELYYRKILTYQG